MARSALAVAALLCLIHIRGVADTHYASPRGADVPPYLSPETAARDIQHATDAAEAGDTVRVLPGTYARLPDAAYVVRDYLRFVGSGPGNTTVVGAVTTGQAVQVRGFRFTGDYARGGLSVLGEGAGTGAAVTDCVFDGVGLGVSGVSADVGVRHCQFRNLPAGASAISALYSGVTIEYCVFELAERAADAMLFDELSTPAVIRNCRFNGCRSGITVGSGGDTLIANCLFRENDIAISAWGRPFTATNCTFYRNRCAVSTVLDLEEEAIVNCIVWGNNTGIVEYYSRRDYLDSTWTEERSMPLITFSLVETNVWWTYPGRGNINADPMFFSPEFDPDLHLYAGSPCIDSGDPFSDYSNEPEPNGGRVNMGAYGNTWEATTSELVDTDGDNMRDDWEVEHFGELSPDGFGDADDDGLSDQEDYRYLADPHNADTDGDGLPDGEEVLQHRTDPILADTDNDGTPDGKEVARGTNPLDPWDAFTIIKFWIEDDQIHVVHPVQPRYWFELESSFWQNGPFGGLSSEWAGRWGVTTHTFTADLNPHTQFFRIKARSY